MTLGTDGERAPQWPQWVASGNEKTVRIFSRTPLGLRPLESLLRTEETELMKPASGFGWHNSFTLAAYTALQRAAASQSMDSLVLVAAQTVVEALRAILARERHASARDGTQIRITTFRRRVHPHRFATRENAHEKYARPGFNGNPPRHGESPRYAS